MEDIRKHLGLDPTAKDYIGDSEVLQFILNAAQEALNDEAMQKDAWENEYSEYGDFEMDFDGLEEEQDYGLLQALRRIFK